MNVIPFTTRLWTGTALSIIFTLSSQSEPVIPGHSRLKADDRSTPVMRGELLLSELGCIQCHTANAEVRERLATPTAPDLTGIGARTTPQWIANYLTDTHGVKPGGKMPDIFHSSDARAKSTAIGFLTQFLTSQGGPLPQSSAGGSEGLVERGRELFHSVGCVACHSPEGSDADTLSGTAVPLPDLAAKTNVDALISFLRNPVAHRPSGRMPDLHLDDKEAKAISVYLPRDQLAAVDKSIEVSGPGISYEYYEKSGLEKLPDFDDLTPSQRGTIDSFTINIPDRSRNDGFALRFRASLEISTAGNYRFWTSSDDGSRLIVDGRVVVDNDGIHPNRQANGRIRLNAGSHELEVQYFEGGGQEEFSVQWQGPGIQRGAIPVDVLTTTRPLPMQPTTWTADFQIQDNQSAMGGRMFAAMRCVNCHSLPGIQPMSPAPAFAGLDPSNSAGCLGDSLSRRAPDYQLSADQKADLAAAVRSLQKGVEPRSHEENVGFTLASLNCYACHNRDGIGGPEEARREFFKTNVEIDLGEEGSIPPTLNMAGAKFKPAALKRIVSQGELHVRHYMTTRMPQFDENVVAPFLDSIHQVDVIDDNASEPPFSKERIEAGKKFVGVTGVACVTCHGIAGQKGIGINGIDLSSAYARLQPGWFRKFLLAPADFNPGTRMPNFWPGGVTPFPNILGGSSEAQIESIWSYLSLGSTMPLPAGIVPEGSVAMELIPSEKTLVHRTFMEGVGPRAILAGYPEKLNIAFDANVIRLAKIWRGRFFDASGVASGRTDRFLSPLGSDTLDLPGGPAVAVLTSPNQAWPTADKASRDVGGKFLGYRLNNQGSPTFRYRLNGLEIEEYVEPVLEPGGPSMMRQFEVSGKLETDGSAWALLAEGSRIESQASTWVVDGKVAIEILQGNSGAKVRQSGEHSQLIVPVQSGSSIVAKIKW